MTSPEIHSQAAARFLRHWRWLLVAALVLGVVLWETRDRWRHFAFDWRAFLASFLEIHWPWIVAAAALSLVAYYGRALRWSVMLVPLRPNPSTWGIFKATAIGFTAVVLLGRPGEFVRPYLISLKERVSLSSQLAAWLLERILDLLAVLVIFGFAITRVGRSHARAGSAFRWALEVGGWAATGLGLVCLVILVMLGRFPETTRRRLLDALSVLPPRFHARSERLVSAFLEGTAATKNQASALLLALYTVLEWVVIVLCFLCVFKAYNETAAFGLPDVLIFLGFVAFGSVIQIPGIGGGVQLVSIVVLTELYRVSIETATGLAIVLWIVTCVVVVPPGLLLAFHEGLNWRKFRDLEKRAVRAGTSAEPSSASEPAL
jgi:uncharacterized membrane protein YbhN (UPF0104 family)